MENVKCGVKHDGISMGIIGTYIANNNKPCDINRANQHPPR